MSAMDAQVGEVVLYNGRAHRITAVDVTTGSVPPYFTLACEHAGPCEAPLRPVSHWMLRRTATEAA